MFIERVVGVYLFASVLEADISSIWCKDDVIYYTFDDFLRQLTASLFVVIQ